MDEQQLRAQASKAIRGLLPPVEDEADDIHTNEDWWQSALIRDPSSPDTGKGKNVKAEKSSVPSEHEQGNPFAEKSSQPSNKQDTDIQLPPAPISDVETPVPQTPSVQLSNDVNASIVQHYLETLYLSNATLAYFVKGPLSRARAAYAEKSSLPELASFLRGLVSTVSLAEKRYKESLPDTIRAHAASTHDSVDEAAKKKRQRKNKNLKRDKNGLLPGEEVMLAEWWAAEDLSLSAVAAFDCTLRFRLPRIRFRETLLQLIIILEALTIEKTISASMVVDEAPQLSQAEDTQAIGGMKSKPKKVKDFAALAETLVDRLTIWQSIEVTDSKKEKQPGASASDGDSQAPFPGDNSDKLKDFCIDTVIPL